MGEKETAREASAPSLSERSTVQDFEKNTERATSGEAGSESAIYQHNQSDLELRPSGGPEDEPPGGASESANLNLSKSSID